MTSIDRRVFTRIRLPVSPGDRVTLPSGRVGTVDTVKVAADGRDAKCTVIVDRPEDER